ncbi:MAG: hypothetical protein R3Y47_11500 [Lachnospiraceae bacterium]
MPIIVLNIFAGTIYTVIALISIANIVNPKWLWKKFESHNAKKEPTKEYFILRRIIGVFGLVVISCMLLFPYLSSLG